MTEGEKER